MSISDEKFRKVVKAVEEVLKDGATRESRKRKNNRIQGFSLDEENIFNEISDSQSPFMLKGQEVPQSERRKLAKQIADDIWRIYTTKLRVGKKFTAGQENDFVSFPSPAALFNDTTRIMYIKGKTGSNHFRVLQRINKDLRNFLNTRSLTDPTRVFWNPNEEFLKRQEKLEEGLEKEYAESGLASKHSDKQKERWFGNKRKRNAEFKDLADQFPQNNIGIEAGHVFGGTVTVATGLFENRQDVINKDVEDVQVISVIPADLKPIIKEAVLKVISADAKIEYKRKAGFNKVLGLVTITVPELGKKNRQEGTAAENRFKELKKIVKKLRPEIFEMRGSPSFRRLISDLVEAKFLGKRQASKTYKTTKKIKGKPKKVSIPIRSPKGGRVRTRVTTKRQDQNRSSSTPNLTRLIAMLNRKLHDEIREDMGKGGSRLRLNYRTGRFAKSAKVQNLVAIKSKNSILAEVKYYGFPYSRFADKGDPLYKLLRDPKGIFGRSIRRILQEQKIANLRRVEVRLRG